jgi:hypothetical protein
MCSDKESQLELLAAVLSVDEKEGETERIVEELVGNYDPLFVAETLQPFSISRKEIDLAEISGAGQLIYREYECTEDPGVFF